MEQSDAYAPLVAEALSRYAFSGMAVRRIRHNENLTLCVGEQYLLRIHKQIVQIRTRPKSHSFASEHTGGS